MTQWDEVMANENLRAERDRLLADNKVLTEALARVLASACMHPADLDGEGCAALDTANAIIAKHGCK